MPATPTVGSPAPPLRGTTLDGGHFDLADHRGRPLIVSFLRHAG